MITEMAKGLELFAPQDLTTTTNGTGVDLLGLRGRDAVVLLSIGVVSGTTPTLDVKIQDSADNTTFADISPAVAFAQKVAAGGPFRLNLPIKDVRRYVRAVATLTGTSPTFLTNVVLLAEVGELPAAAQA